MNTLLAFPNFATDKIGHLVIGKIIFPPLKDSSFSILFTCYFWLEMFKQIREKRSFAYGENSLTMTHLKKLNN